MSLEPLRRMNLKQNISHTLQRTRYMNPYLTEDRLRQEKEILLNNREVGTHGAI